MLSQSGICKRPAEGADPEDFVQGPKFDYGSIREICESCPVRRECLEFALCGRVNHGTVGRDHR